MKKDDLTILLMLKDRIAFTKRWLDYMAYVKFPFKIYIADGSIDDQAKDYLETNKKRFECLDINYVRYPYDANFSVYYKKIADALDKIKTKYTAVSDNDDFYVVDGLDKSIDFMNSHDDYSSCRGEISAIAVYSKTNDPDLKFLYGRSGSITYKYYTGESVENERSSDRVMQHAFCYFPTFYDVHRTGHLKMCFEALRDINPENLYLAEYITSYLTAAAGKIKRLPCLYYVRQLNAPGSSNAAESEKYDFFDRMMLPSWSHDFNGAAEAVSKIISDKDGIAADEAKTIFMKAYKKHVAANIIWSVKRKDIVKPSFGAKVMKKYSNIKTRIFKSLFWMNVSNIRKTNRKYYASIKPIVDFLSGVK